MNIDDDDFKLFGLEERFALDTQRLSQRWRDLQAEVHPDRFAAQGAAARRVAMQWSVRVNEAYRRLKDPLKRAAYLCERRGVPVDAERNTAMSREFLMHQMSWREALDEAGDTDAVQRLDGQVALHENALLQRVQQALDEQRDAKAAAALVRELMFVTRFRNDIDQRLDAMHG
jgi:molecular chaperone HscB